MSRPGVDPAPGRSVLPKRAVPARRENPQLEASGRLRAMREGVLDLEKCRWALAPDLPQALGAIPPAPTSPSCDIQGRGEVC